MTTIAQLEVNIQRGAAAFNTSLTMLSKPDCVSMPWLASRQALKQLWLKNSTRNWGLAAMTDTQVARNHQNGNGLGSKAEGRD